MSAHILRNSFNAGEISPLMDARTDAERYDFGCRRLENFVARIYGGAFRRQGMMFLGKAKDSANPVRLIPFNFSTQASFVLELGEEYLRIWDDGELVRDSDGDIIELATPWPGARVFDIQYVQLNDVVYLTNYYHPVQKLIRRANDDWTIESVAYSYPCLGGINATEITARVYDDSGEDTLEFANFDADTDYPYILDVSARTALDPSSFGTTQWVGVHFELIHRRDASSVELALTSTADSSSLRVVGTVELLTYGTWTGTVLLQRLNADGSTWDTIRDFKGAADRNVIFEYTTEGEETLRLSYTSTSSSGSPRAVLEAADSRVRGLVKITEWVSNSKARVEIINATLDDSTTTEWSREAWNGVDGFPTSIAFHEQRLCFGGTKSAPTTFWGSVTGDFQNFRRSTNDDGSFAFTLAAQEGSAIRSMLSQENLLLFTETEEWSVSTSERTPLTPTNPFVRRHSRYGSAAQQPIVANQAIAFVQRGGRKLREYQQNELESLSVATDLSLLSEHVTKGGIVQFAFQQNPDPVIWAVTGAGVLLSLTYETQQNVIAWARHPTDGLVESVAVVYGSGADEIWLVVNREDERFIERLDVEATSKLEDGETSQLVYLDSSIMVVNSSPKTGMGGLNHLANRTVSVLVDGNPHPDVLVASNGTITLDRPGTTIVAGLPYESILQPSRIEIALDDGTSQGRKTLTKRAVVNLWRSRGLEYADSIEKLETDAFELVGPPISTPLGDPHPLLTGEYDLVNRGAHRRTVDLAFRQTKPLPANILGIVVKCEIMGN